MNASGSQEPEGKDNKTLISIYCVDESLHTVHVKKKIIIIQWLYHFVASLLSNAAMYCNECMHPYMAQHDPWQQTTNMSPWE